MPPSNGFWMTAGILASVAVCAGLFMQHYLDSATTRNNDQITTVVFDLGGVLLEWNPTKFIAALHPDSPSDAESLHESQSTLTHDHSGVTAEHASVQGQAKVGDDIAARSGVAVDHLTPQTRRACLEGMTSSAAWKAYNRGTATLTQAALDWAKAKRSNSETTAAGNCALPSESDLASLFEDFGLRVPALMTPIPAGLAALRRVDAQQRYRLLVLSNFPRDNYEAVRTLWPEVFEPFSGAVMSFEVALMKPQREIYLRLLDEFHLRAGECVFIDDKPENVAGAVAVGMVGVSNLDRGAQLEARLAAIGIL
ncbi:hypothetical protein CAOG_07809 [Capsaspora owczarzaki ATCC 30864]|nr:hypothetical protein CAOG_07809 [Capsaspora owczarzaki ATCC 30864]|eukprot:XP_004342882.1 hypothetical protein CAOG_07809 [Capsaspora owczarzaki ATCC 30864]